MTTTTSAKARAQARARSRARKRFISSWGPWIAALAVVLLGLAIWVAGSKPTGGTVAASKSAPTFTLPASDGSQVSLADFEGRSVLLYFNEGVGCDACFYQMTSLEQDVGVLEEAGITKVIPIAVNPMPDVRETVERFDLKTPWLVDADMSVSDAYGMIGTGMHADLPGHGFVLVDGSGNIKWTMAYPSMYASAQQIVADMESKD